MPLTVVMPRKAVFNVRAIENALDGAATGAQADMDTTVMTWETPADFTITSRPGERIIGTDDKRWGWIDQGTKPHVITPKRRRVLTFSPGGRPKSPLSGRIGSNKGSAGRGQVFARRVRHPGIKPRLWTKAIAAKWQRQLSPIVQRAIDSEVSG